MQARKRQATGSVSLVTHLKGKERKDPIWELRYRLPNGKNSDKVLGKAWTKQSRPAEGYLTRGQAEALGQEFLDSQAEFVPDDRRTFARGWDDFVAYKIKIKRPLRGTTLHEYERLYAKLAERPWKGRTWAERPIATITVEDVTEVYSELEDRELSASTINHYRRVMRAVLGPASTRDWPHLSEAPIEESRGKLRFYDPPQVTQLKTNAYDDVDRAIFTLATEAGPRMSEILGLKVGNVDFEIGRVRIEDGYTKIGGHAGTKSHQVRSVPMSDNIRAALHPFCAGRDKDALVFCRAGQNDLPLCGTSLYRRFQSAAVRAGLPSIRFHELRHSFGTRAIRMFNIYEVQRMMGHASITTTERYLHYAPDPDGAAKLSGLWESDQGAEIIQFRPGIRMAS